MKRYKLNKGSLWLLCAMSLLLCACGKNEDNNNGKIIDEGYRAVQVTPISGLRIAWDYSSMTRLADKGELPRMIRISDHSLMLVYALDDKVYMKRSSDDGQTWDSPVTLFNVRSHTAKDGDDDITYSEPVGQPAIIRLSSSDLVVACAVKYRYTKSDVTTEFPAAIRIRRINGSTMQPEAEQDVYVNPGAEHPALLQLPDGTLQLYFSNGSVAQSLEMINNTAMPGLGTQYVALIESQDEGLTWSSRVAEIGFDGIDRAWTGARTVALRPGKNNILPAPAIADGQLVVAVADNKTVNYKPYIVRSPLSENWTTIVSGDTPDREYALYELLPDKYFLSAPCLLTLLSGETLLSYETNEGRNTGYEVMEVSTGSEDAYNFTRRTRPFPMKADEYATGNSLMLFDSRTVLALTTSNRGLTDKSTAPWYMKGYLLNDLEVTPAGDMSYPLFVGGNVEANLTAGLDLDATYLYVGVKVNDLTSVAAAAGAQQGDGVYLYIDASNRSLLDVDEGIYKFWIASTGETARWEGKEGKWLASSAEGSITANVTPTAGGYTVDIAIPRSQLSGFNGQQMRFGIGISDYTGTEAGSIDLLSLCKDLSSSTWLGVTFKNE